MVLVTFTTKSNPIHAGEESLWLLDMLQKDKVTRLLELRIIIRSLVFLFVSKEMAKETSESIDWMASEVYCCNTKGATA